MTTINFLLILSAMYPMGMWINPLINIPSMINTPIIELEAANSVSAYNGINPHMMPTHTTYANLNRKRPTKCRSYSNVFHEKETSRSLIPRSELVGGSSPRHRKKPMSAREPMHIKDACRLKESLMTPPINGPRLRPKNMDILNRPMVVPSRPLGVISPI